MRLLLKITNRYSVANCLKVHVTRLFPSFPAFCCVHFLTFVSNSVTISQRAKTARKPENLHLFVSVVSELHRFLGAKL